MSFIIRRIKAWRYGYTGISGLNQMQNNWKMLAIMLGPFLAVWYTAQYMIYEEIIPPEFASPTLIAALLFWVIYCVAFYFWVATDAAKYKVFPQAKCYFPDGGVIPFDLKIKPEGITERCKWKDGSVGIEVAFANRYLYQARDMDFPYVFQKAVMRIPSEIGNSFKFLNSGEFWHKGMVVETPNCEHVSYYVYGWVRENGEWKPVGVINDCSYRFAKSLENYSSSLDVEAKEAKSMELLYKGALQREDELRQYTTTLEDTLSTALDQGGKTVKKQVDGVLSMVRDLVHDITETQTPIWKRIFNFTSILKVIIIGVLIWAFLHFALNVI